MLDQLDVEPVIEIRKTASTSSGGCQLRREEEVLLIKKLGYEGWKRVKDADSRRWIAEIVFSSPSRPLIEENTISAIHLLLSASLTRFHPSYPSFLISRTSSSLLN